MSGKTPSRAVFFTPYCPGTAPPSSRASASRPDSESRSSTRREVLLGEGFDRGCPGPRHLDTDRRHVRRGEPLVEAGEKARRRARLRADAAGDDDPVERHARRCRTRSSTRSAESACQSGLPAFDANSPPSRRPSSPIFRGVASAARAGRPFRARRRAGTSIGSLSARTRSGGTVPRVAQGLLDQRADAPVDRAGEYERRCSSPSIRPSSASGTRPRRRPARRAATSSGRRCASLRSRGGSSDRRSAR